VLTVAGILDADQQGCRDHHHELFYVDPWHDFAILKTDPKTLMLLLTVWRANLPRLKRLVKMMRFQ
jgi:hypothetical protein